MQRTLCAIPLVILTTLPLDASSAQDKKDRPDRDEILASMMQKKLKNAHLVLDGVAIGDFKKITSGGEELIKLAKSETWQLIRSPHYERHSDDFIQRTESLVKKAKEKNMDGTALAYVEMTLSCVRCHQYVREHRRDASLPLGLRNSVSFSATTRCGSPDGKENPRHVPMRCGDNFHEATAWFRKWSPPPGGR